MSDGEGGTQRAWTGLAIAAVAVALAVASCAGAAEPSDFEVPVAPTSDITTTTADAATPATAPATTPTSSIATDDVAPSAADVLLELGDTQIAAFGGITCAEEAIALTIAAELHVADTGEEPTSLGQLAPLLVEAPALWTWDDGDRLPQPLPGSGCSAEGFDPPNGANQNICTLERRTIEIAVEAYVALNPEANPPDEVDLVGSLLNEMSDLWDVIDGEIIVAPGSSCETS